MTQNETTKLIRRWQFVALAALALLVGYIAGQLTPTAGAQVGVTSVQLDTGNCRTGSVSPRSYDRSDVQNVPDGVIVTAVYMVPAAGGGVEPRFIYTVCQ